MSIDDILATSLSLHSHKGGSGKTLVAMNLAAYLVQKGKRVALIDGERETYKKEMMKYKKMVETNASLYERLQQSQIENYLKRAESILKR